MDVITCHRHDYSALLSELEGRRPAISMAVPSFDSWTHRVNPGGLLDLSTAQPNGKIRLHPSDRRLVCLLGHCVRGSACATLQPSRSRGKPGATALRQNQNRSQCPAMEDSLRQDEGYHLRVPELFPQAQGGRGMRVLLEPQQRMLGFPRRCKDEESLTAAFRGPVPAGRSYSS